MKGFAARVSVLPIALLAYPDSEVPGGLQRSEGTATSSYPQRYGVYELARVLLFKYFKETTL